MNLGFVIIVGCDCTFKQICTTGIFESFKVIETFRKLKEDIIPAIYRASCSKRNTLFCVSKCRRSMYGINVKGNISWSKLNKIGE